MPLSIAKVETDEEALVQVCGGEDTAEHVKTIWADLLKDGRLDLSGQRLGDEKIGRLLKGLHM